MMTTGERSVAAEEFPLFAVSAEDDRHESRNAENRLIELRSALRSVRGGGQQIH